MTSQEHNMLQTYLRLLETLNKASDESLRAIVRDKIKDIIK